MEVDSATQYTFADSSRIQQNGTAWNGDATQFDFTLDTREWNALPFWICA